MWNRFSANRNPIIYFFLFLFVVLITSISLALPVSATDKRPLLIDAHNHIIGQYRAWQETVIDYQGAAEAALKKMNEVGIRTMVVMPPPFPPGHPGIFDVGHLADIAKDYPGRFVFLGGGESLNVMIQRAVRSGSMSPGMKARFREKALRILGKGAAGFGELAAEHLSFNPRHPYEWAPPDHPLFLLLSDIAARHGVPIYLHMEAVPKEMPLPAGFSSPPNPERLHANIGAFERLLDHNRRAKIVWVQAGWDHTGYRTVGLCRELLKRHPNLYMTIKISPRDSPPLNRPTNPTGRIKPEWLALFNAFPDRFLIGTDQFYLPPGAHRHIGPQRVKTMIRFFRRLPANLQWKMGVENPEKVLRLKEKIKVL